MTAFWKILAAMAATTGLPGLCLAQAPCRPVDRGQMHAAVEDAVALNDGNGEVVMIGRLVDAWREECRSAAERIDPAVIRDVARLLDTRAFTFMATYMLYQVGDNARPMRRRVHRAAVRMHREFVANSPSTGPDYSTDQGLQCLDIRLRTGRRVQEHCVHLEPPAELQ